MPDATVERDLSSCRVSYRSFQEFVHPEAQDAALAGAAGQFVESPAEFGGLPVMAGRFLRRTAGIRDPLSCLRGLHVKVK